MASSVVIAKRYARALLQMAPTPNEAVQWLEPMGALAETIENSPELSKLLASRAFSAEQKWAVVSELAKKLSAPADLEKFLKVLVDSQRINNVVQIAKTFKTMLLDKQNTIEATVESATELAAPQKQKIQELLEKTLSKKVVLSVRIEPTLLAGFRVNVAGLTMDASLASNIESIHRNLLRADFAKKGVRAEA